MCCAGEVHSDTADVDVDAVASGELVAIPGGGERAVAHKFKVKGSHKLESLLAYSSYEEFRTLIGTSSHLCTVLADWQTSRPSYSDSPSVFARYFLVKAAGHRASLYF
jgi:hypothetical protein